MPTEKSKLSDRNKKYNEMSSKYLKKLSTKFAHNL